MDTYWHAIEAVVRRTGLSAHVIRIWEKRYGAVRPQRTGTNRRRYTEEQIERLQLLRRLTQDGGESIGAMAQLPTERLRLLAAEVGRRGRGGGAAGAQTRTAAELVGQALMAVRALDARALERVLREAELTLGAQGMLQGVAAPLAQRIGDEWRAGAITAAHEHFASAVLRTWLGQATRAYAVGSDAPALIVATPAGQYHELGALLVGALAANLGWRVIYLGASLPAADIAAAARQHQARAVALSLVYPADDTWLEGELTRLRSLLPAKVPLIAGGQAAPAYTPVLARIGAQQAAALEQLGAWLDRVRLPDAATKTQEQVEPTTAVAAGADTAG